MCLQAGNKSLRLNIALSPNLGGDCNSLLKGDQGLARARKFCCCFRIGPDGLYLFRVGFTLVLFDKNYDWKLRRSDRQVVIFSNLKSDWHPHRRRGAAECLPTLVWSFLNIIWFSSYGMVYLDSPVTSDIVKRDRLSNAEAHKEDVCLYFYCQYEGHYSLKSKSGTTSDFWKLWNIIFTSE